MTLTRLLSIGTLAAFGLAVHVSTANAQTSLTGSFRNDPGDGVKSDSYGTYAGFHTWQPAKGPRVIHVDGLYINSNGGIDLNLEPTSAGDPVLPDRALVLRLPQFDACKQTSEGYVSAYDVDFRFNANTNNLAGVENMPVGSTQWGDAASNSTCANCAYGVVDFTLANGVRWALFFNNSHGPILGSFSLTRNSDTSWTLSSTADVVVTCSVKKSYTIGTYSVPFELTVSR